MPYVQRNQSGKVKGIFSVRQEGYGEEFLSDDEPEVISFLNPPPTPLQVKRKDEIAALGTRAELLAEVDAMTGASPQVKIVMRKLAEIAYSATVGTID